MLSPVPHPYPLTAGEAEKCTGLTAREIHRPAFDKRETAPRKRRKLSKLPPNNPAMRYQLGRYRLQSVVVDGRHIANVDVFEVIGVGRTWADAAASAKWKLGL